MNYELHVQPGVHLPTHHIRPAPACIAEVLPGQPSLQLSDCIGDLAIPKGQTESSEAGSPCHLLCRRAASGAPWRMQLMAAATLPE